MRIMDFILSIDKGEVINYINTIINLSTRMFYKFIDMFIFINRFA